MSAALRLLTFNDLMAYQPSPSLVRGLLRWGDLCVIHGSPACGKTFLVLSLAVSVCAGRPWHGSTTSPGRVIYIAAEGIHGLRLRLLAACHEEPDLLHGITRNLTVVNGSVSLQLRDEVGTLLNAIAALPEKPALVVFDTLSRCFAGADENSAQDMSTLVANTDMIRDRTGAAVLLVHHDTKNGSSKGSERGSGVLRGAADVMIGISKKKESGVDVITAVASKVKDGPLPTDLRFRLDTVRIEASADDPETSTTSCRLTPVRLSADPWTRPRESVSPSPADGLDERSRTILNTLARDFDPSTAPTSAALHDACGGARTTFYERLRRLVDEGLVTQGKAGTTLRNYLPAWTECR